MSYHIHAYSEVRQQIRDDLPVPHPEWVEPTGESLMCLMELLDRLTQEKIQRVYRYPVSLAYLTGRLKIQGSHRLVKELDKIFP